MALVFVAPKPIVSQNRDAILQASMNFAVRKSAFVMIIVNRCMVLIADTFVLTMKTWIKTIASSGLQQRTVETMSETVETMSETWILVPLSTF